MDRFEAMRVFVAVCEAESLAGAGRALRLSPPVVTRTIRALEERLGARLLLRTTRSLRVTEAGAAFLSDCKRILSEVEEAEASVAGAHGEPRGRVSLTAPVLFGRMHVAPGVFAFVARYPGVTVRMLLLDRVADLIDEAIDVAVRIAPLRGASLRAVRVGSVRRVVCASPQYLAVRGVPKTPGDLARHELIVREAASTAPEWSFGGKAPGELPARLVVNSPELAIAAARAGLGLARVLSYQVAAQVAAGELRLVLEDHEPAPVPVQVVHHEGRQGAARVRALVEFLVARLRVELASRGRAP
jgi:DNA-binding transcriptional LysR family regulator